MTVAAVYIDKKNGATRTSADYFSFSLSLTPSHRYTKGSKNFGVDESIRCEKTIEPKTRKKKMFVCLCVFVC